MPRQRPRSSRSAFALYARALRDERGLTMDELAAAAKVHVSTIKNIECDRHVSIETVGRVYRDGLPKKHRLQPAQWHQLVGYWLLIHFPDGITLPDVTTGIHAAETATATAADDLTAKMRAALGELTDSDGKMILAIVAAAGGKRGRKVLAHLRTLLDIL